MRVKCTSRTGALTVPAVYLREIGVGSWQGVKISVHGNRIVIEKKSVCVVEIHA